jgi:hypothetical protein
MCLSKKPAAAMEAATATPVQGWLQHSRRILPTRPPQTHLRRRHRQDRRSKICLSGDGMKPTPKTIQIFLPGGDPRGIRIAEITTRILQVIEVPRSLLSDFLKMPESNQVALYFLIGSLDGSDDPEVYIGQTGDLRARLVSHNKNKDFWERALIVTSRTNSMTQTHALFLEWHCIQAIRQAGRYSDQNGTSGTRPHTPAPLQADCLEIFDTARTLLSTLGYPVFETVAKTTSTENSSDILYCNRPGVNGRGQYTSEGFVVLKESVGNLELAPSLRGSSVDQKRLELLKSGTYRVEGDKIVLEKDHLFNSPSMASAFLTGKGSNGWIDWKDETGRTLDELERKATSVESTLPESANAMR